MNLSLNPKMHRLVNKGDHRRIKICGREKKFPYTLWLQKKSAPIVCIVPGMGNHRLSEQTVAMANAAYASGFSVVTISSVMNWEFMRHGATAMVPGMLSADATDVYSALRAIIGELRERYSDRIDRASLLGLSLGAAHALYISGMDREADAPLFDRYVAVNPPVDMLYGLQQLDDYYNAPLAWPEGEREERMMNTLLSAAAIADELPNKLPFDEVQSRYLIGLSFRLILRDILFTLESKGLKVANVEYSKSKREPLYEEFEKFSYRDYMLRVAAPYYLSRIEANRTGEAAALDEIIQSANLRTYEDYFAKNGLLRVFTSEDDFLLRPSDVEWLQRTFGDRLTLFSDGSHLGNLYLKDVQDQIMDSLRSESQILLPSR